jgi:Xaa-Pro aminopeptidase
VDFTPEEFSARLARLREAMRGQELDAVLVDDSEMLAHFTGYETSLNRYRACIVPREGTPVMVLRSLDAAPFRQQAWFDANVAVPDTEDIALAVAKALEPYRRVGFDPSSHAMSVSTYHKLPHARFAPVPLRDLRLVKSAAEIARIRRAAELVDQVLGELIEAAVPGVTPRRLMARAAARLITLAADPAHIGYIAAARGWDFLHAQPEDKPLETGDVLHIELVARYRGYEARLMRCVVLGEIPPQLAQGANRLVQLQDQQIAAMKPGAVARDVDAILRAGVLAAGLRETYPNVTGYTLGYYSRQPLRSSDFTRCFLPDADWRLEPGMAFHMYTSAAGVSFSETVLVGEAGPERLTQLERRLFAR